MKAGESVMPPKRRIAVFVSFSGQGGVERMINNLSQGFLDAGFEVDMILARARGEHVQSIPPGVDRVMLGTKHTWQALGGLIRYLREREPDAVLAVKDRAIRVAVTARLLSGSQVHLAGRIGTTVSAALKGKSPFRTWGWHTGMRLFYRRTDRIVAVSEGVADDIRAITGLTGSRICVVQNPVITERMLAMAKEPLDHPWVEDNDTRLVIGIGRLTYQKDFTSLIKAFFQTRKMVGCRLIILGEGEQRHELESLVKGLRMEKNVLMPGFVDNPYKWLARSSLFVLSSRWEGSPNALTEALALGIPSVSTDCRSGPREVLAGGRFGPLVRVGDIEELSNAMIRTLEDPLPGALLREAVSRYTVSESVEGYLEALNLSRDAGQIPTARRL